MYDGFVTNFFVYLLYPDLYMYHVQNTTCTCYAVHFTDILSHITYPFTSGELTNGPFIIMVSNRQSVLLDTYRVCPKVQLCS